MGTPTLKDDGEEDAEEAEEEEEAEEDEEVEEEEEQSEEQEEEEEDVEVAEVERPDDDDDESGGSLTSGKTFGISNKFLLLAGIGAALLVIYLKYVRARANSTTEEFEPEQGEQEVENAMDEPPEGEVHIEKSDADPLSADEQAVDYIFEDQQ